MLEAIGTGAGVLAAISYVPYIRDILKKSVKPERATWLIWSVLALTASKFVAERHNRAA